MTTTTDITATGQDDQVTGLPDPEPGPGRAPQQEQGPRFTDRPMIPVEMLTAHPGNVREDRQADRQFCQSVAAAGIITPLEITTSPDHDSYLVVDGNIRLDAALKLGLDAVPYVFSPGTADQAGQQYLHMLISSRFRRDLTVHEEAAALFGASESGMTKAEIRRSTGLKASEVRAGILAGGLSSKTRELTEAACYDWTLEDLALIAPFEDDPATMERILEAVGYGQPLAYIVQKIDDERQARERRAQLTAELEAQGVTVLDHAPDGATSLYLLRPDPAPGDDDSQHHDGDSTSADADGSGEPEDEQAPGEMDPAAHASCPGAVAVFRTWQQEPNWYCLDPDKYGHARKHQAALLPAGLGAADPVTGSPADSPAPDPGRKLVIEGNKAWDAAGKVRHRWLAELLSRKAPPPGTGTLVPQFVTTQMLTMPQPLRQALGGIRNTDTYQRLGGPAPADAEGAAQPRLWMLALAPIAAAYEDQMTGTGDQRSTWRTDRYSPCPRPDAGTWLTLLSRAGYPLSPIERAVADGVPYQGDAPAAAMTEAGGNNPGDDQAADQPGNPDVTSEPGEDDSTADRTEADEDTGLRPQDTSLSGAGQDHMTAQAA